MPAAFKFLILTLLSKKPPLYGFLVLKPGSCDRLIGNFSRSGDRLLVSVPIYPLYTLQSQYCQVH
ncbi:hypothetical protein QUA81_13725 [Microcoleus sp. F6_B4]